MSKDHVIVTNAKVANIVAPSQLAITAGRASGIQKGDEAIVRRVIAVTDPDSGKSLGEVVYAKVLLEINFVSEKFSVGRVKDTAPRSQLGADITRIVQTKTLTYEESDASPAVVWVSPGDQVVVRRAIAEEVGEE